MLLPTPAAADGSGGRYNRARAGGEGGTLPGMVRDKLLPTPVTDPLSGNGHARSLGGEIRLLPTPTVLSQDGERPDTWLERRERVKGTGVNGNGMGTPLVIAAQMVARGDAERLLPTPTVGNITGGNKRRGGDRSDELLLPGVAGEVEATGTWGPFQAAIDLWESVVERDAPSPVETPDTWFRMVARRRAGKDPRPVGMRGSLRRPYRMGAALPEWMMGYPAGHLTGVPGNSRADALKQAGNGVVPQQAALAAEIVLGGWD